MARLSKTAVAGAALAMLVATGAAARAQDLLNSLIEQAGAGKLSPTGSVEVLGWIDRSAATPVLVISFSTQGEVKLVADPGITVQPIRRPGFSWRDDAPVERKTVGADYFAAPPVIALPFDVEDGQPIEARVEYAYCVVDYQCLFGEQTVSVGTDRPAG